MESRVEFARDAAGSIAALTWQRTGASPRTARRVEIERHEDVRFSNGGVQLAGTLIEPQGCRLYFTTIREWLATRIPGFGAAASR